MGEAVDCCALWTYKEAPGALGAGGFARAGYCPGATVAWLAAPAPPGLAPPEAGAVAPPGDPTEGTALGDTVGGGAGVGVVDGDVLVLWPPPRVVPVWCRPHTLASIGLPVPSSNTVMITITTRNTAAPLATASTQRGRP